MNHSDFTAPLSRVLIKPFFLVENAQTKYQKYPQRELFNPKKKYLTAARKIRISITY